MALEDLEVSIVTEYDPAIAVGMGKLLPDLYDDYTGEPTDEGLLRNIIDSPERDQLLAIYRGRIVGMATLNLVVHQLRRKAFLDNFVVAVDIESQGVGSALWQAIGDWCLKMDAPYLIFNSDYKPQRERAHRFYKDRGAVIRDTTFFGMMFDGQPVTSESE